MNVFWKHYQKNEETFFLACIHEYVSAVTMESEKITTFCRITKTFHVDSVQFP